MLIIGIGHKKHSGKDTLAQMLFASLIGEHNTIIHPFAHQLKWEVANACGVSTEVVDNNKDVFRPALQWWGTEFRRKFQDNDNYWVFRTETYLAGLNPKIAIISDVRFPNEAEWVKSKGGKLVKITRPGYTSTDSHSSEIALDDYAGWDMTIVNDGSKEELLQKARGIVNSLIIPNL